MLAGLKLNGLLARAEGIILGDFHNGDTELSSAVFKMLKYHLPSKRTPIVRLDNFGHVWPIAPIPMHRQVTLRCRKSGRGKPRVTIQTPWDQWAR
jgi:muramoyltetrapeptide carboxypeptidase LdcA involved in peptidoglycan recycling